MHVKRTKRHPRQIRKLLNPGQLCVVHKLRSSHNNTRYFGKQDRNMGWPGYRPDMNGTIDVFGNKIGFGTGSLDLFFECGPAFHQTACMPIAPLTIVGQFKRMGTSQKKLNPQQIFKRSQPSADGGLSCPKMGCGCG